MLSQTEFNATLAIGTNPLDGSPIYNYNKETRRQMYRSYKEGQEMQTEKCFPTHYNYLAPVTTACTADHRIFDILPFKKEEENSMNYASATVTTAPTETQTQRKYLEDRLSYVYRDKRGPLEAQFGLIDDEPPVTLKELQERIAAGKFTFRDEKDVRPYHHWTEMLRWRDPAKKADAEGFKAAKEDLKAKRQATLDTIKIDDVKAGLDAVKALEAWTPAGAAN